jgi:hypothetical protein
LKIDKLNEIEIENRYLNPETKIKLLREVEELDKKVIADRNRIEKVQENIDGILESMLGNDDDKLLKAYGETIKNLSTSIEAINKAYLSNNQYKILGSMEIVTLMVKWAKETGDTQFLNKLEEWNSSHVRLR